MTNAERARAIVEDHLNSVSETAMEESIAAALREARDEACEEAAKVVEAKITPCPACRLQDAYMTHTCEGYECELNELVSAIRALKSPPEKGEKS